MDFIIMHPQFRNSDGSYLPASQTAILEWVGWLGGMKRLQPKTIKSYITHLRVAHIDADLPSATCESPLLQRLIRGIKCFTGERERNPKLPITCDILRAILESATHSSELGKLNFEASTTLAFSAFLRCREFMIPASKEFDLAIHLTTDAIKFVPSFELPSHVVLTLPSSKTDPFRKGVDILIARALGTCTCAVVALQSLFRHAHKPRGSALFMQDDGSPLSRSNFLSRIKLSLTNARFDASQFSGHSFRQGAASSAAAVRSNDYEIQQLGRWCSDSYKLYVDGSQARILLLSAHLHWVIPHSQHPEPLSLLFLS